MALLLVQVTHISFAYNSDSFLEYLAKIVYGGCGTTQMAHPIEKTIDLKSPSDYFNILKEMENYNEQGPTCSNGVETYSHDDITGIGFGEKNICDIKNRKPDLSCTSTPGSEHTLKRLNGKYYWDDKIVEMPKNLWENFIQVRLSFSLVEFSLLTIVIGIVSMFFEAKMKISILSKDKIKGLLNFFIRIIKQPKKKNKSKAM